MVFWLRQSTSWLTIACYLAATTNVPMPTLSISRAAEFPCQFHGCGCLNADMCRTKCCCSKLAKPMVRCCKKGKKPLAGCPLPDAKPLMAAVAPVPKNPPRGNENRRPQHSSSSTGWVIGSMSCQGVVPTFAAVGPVAPIEPTPISRFELAFEGHVDHVSVCLIPRDALHPPAPPPRAWA